MRHCQQVAKTTTYYRSPASSASSSHSSSAASAASAAAASCVLASSRAATSAPDWARADTFASRACRFACRLSSCLHNSCRVWGVCVGGGGGGGQGGRRSKAILRERCRQGLSLRLQTAQLLAKPPVGLKGGEVKQQARVEAYEACTQSCSYTVATASYKEATATSTCLPSPRSAGAP